MRFFILLTLLAASGVSTAQAQNIPLEQLLHLSSLPATLTPATQATARLTDWTFWSGAVPPKQEPLSWTWWPDNLPESERVGDAPALLSLRPNHTQQDVVLHLTRVATFNHLRRQMERQNITPEPVTCLGCPTPGERYLLATCSVVFYQGKPGAYPFLVVVQSRGLPPAVDLTPAKAVAPRGSIGQR